MSKPEPKPKKEAHGARKRYASTGGRNPKAEFVKNPHGRRKVQIREVLPRETALTAKPLSLAERKASVAKIAATAPEKVREGIKLIDFREPSAKERAYAETLVPRAREALARSAKRVAA